MNLSIRVAIVTGTLLAMLAHGRESAAADQKAALEKIKGHVQAATSAFGEKNFEKMKTELNDAVTAANENELAGNQIMAKVYVLMGVMEVTGFKNNKDGIANFVKALAISPSATVPVNMTSKPVRTAFAKAEDQDAASTAESEKVAEKEAAAAPAEPVAAAPAPAAAEKPAKETKAEKAERERAEKAAQKAEEKARLEAERTEKAQADKDRTERAEKESLQKEKDRLQKEKQDRESQLADNKSRLQQIEKEKGEKDKQLAAVQDSAKKEREAKDKLAGEKQSLEKQLADAKARIAQLEKEKSDKDKQLGEKDKQLAAGAENEKKEREAKEKLDKARQDLEAREKDRKAREVAERQERDKLADGPALPGSINEAIFCTMPDEIQSGVDLFVHCVPRSNAATKHMVFYYRPASSVLYNAQVMERSKKGWYVAMIPGSRIGGKLMHYYVESRDDRQVLGSNGQTGSPNIATVRAGRPAVAASAPSQGAEPAAVAEIKKPAARRGRTKDRARR